MRKLLSVLLLTVAVFIGMASLAGPAAAAPLHQHELVTPAGRVDLALGFCKNPQLFGFGERNHFVFDHFHDWIHLGPVVPTAIRRSDCATEV